MSGTYGCCDLGGIGYNKVPHELLLQCMDQSAVTGSPPIKKQVILDGGSSGSTGYSLCD